MAIESAAIPLPSEVIMPFSGYLVSTGIFSLFGIALAGAIGSVIGSLFLYALGYFGGRPLIEKYGRYIFISHRDLQRADAFFSKYGHFANFIGRLLPVFRTYISFPAGIARSKLPGFVCFTFSGSFLWSLLLGWIGQKLGQNWNSLSRYFHQADAIIGYSLALAIIWYVYRHFRRID